MPNFEAILRRLAMLDEAFVCDRAGLGLGPVAGLGPVVGAAPAVATALSYDVAAALEDPSGQ
jgi:hypothetical protein